jgi:hypothetical protein
MNQSPELLKSFANRMAQKAMQGDVRHVIRVLQLAGLVTSPSEEGAFVGGLPASPGNPPSLRKSSSADQVGIWKRRADDNGNISFVRRPDLAGEWELWANVGVIPSRRTKWRIALVGESVARGYLYDPEFTPASVLQAFLQFQLGPEHVEVIDLARTNLGFEVGDLAKAALNLEPDVVIIFAGNNWRFTFSESDIFHLGTALQQWGVAGLKRFNEERLAGKIKDMIADVASAYRQTGVPVVWIVPDFNLGDWREPKTLAPVLENGANQEWVENYRDAQSAMAAHDAAAARTRAERMIAFDGGTTTAGFYILAQCSRQAGDIEGTRRYLELARDAVIWDQSRHISPRAYSVTQNTLRQEATRHHFRIVDLPKIVQEHLHGEIPDRRIFLDYCHMTPEGMRLAMFHAAVEVVRLLRLDPREMPMDLNIAPSRKIQADAEFLAAIHNAHWHQRREIVQYHCVQALRAAPSVAKLMVDFLDLQTRSGPALMCRAAEQIVATQSSHVQRYLFHSNIKQLDILLGDIVGRLLGKLGVDAVAQFGRFRREEHSAVKRRVNLLDYYHCSAGDQPQELKWAISETAELSSQGASYYQAYGPESKFVFIGEADHPLRLCLTCRMAMPCTSPPILFIDVNSRRQAEVEIGFAWMTWDIELAGDAVNDGPNEIVLHWPTPEFQGTTLIEKAAKSIFEKASPELYCVFGQIHSFSICAGSTSQSRQSPTPNNISIAASI